MLSSIRLLEPYVWNHFKKDFCSCFLSKKTKAAKNKFSSEPLCAFANSAMNIEFVYQILLGTSYFLESRSLSPYEQKTSKLKIQNKGNETAITFCDIKFKDIKKWDVDQTSN